MDATGTVVQHDSGGRRQTRSLNRPPRANSIGVFSRNLPPQRWWRARRHRGAVGTGDQHGGDMTDHGIPLGQRRWEHCGCTQTTRLSATITNEASHKADSRERAVRA